MHKTRVLLDEITKLASQICRRIRLMEVCGTHTRAIAKYGIKQALPTNIELISGPGCPVCVTTSRDIDFIIELALRGIPVITYGDMLRVPGSRGSLEDARAKGSKVHMVYSTVDALRIAEKEPKAVFFAIGFETTSPATAYAVKHGLRVYSTHKLIPPAMEAIAESPELRIEGFINPGHVSTIIGVEAYPKLAVPQVITGFEEPDILEAVAMLLKQISRGRHEVENQYTRAVRQEGNELAKQAVDEVFEVADAAWRGLGVIINSGLRLKPIYKGQDAAIIYRGILEGIKPKENPACRCGDVLRGTISPQQCPLFGSACTPSKPVGPCMVSYEGSCGVAYSERKP
ncbi:hydrogenase formation protein HypD [Candidatus Woesearchaeota archaeon CG10_big_fil_rev_8_21_14_0_10_47_5]|nr:MAG: hydrogenase formation protein HypD [Candidatus Woesearchaeota archaeon CG1_02_47_18]PIN75959.1 MAG: hydrogenase formation protein HypD [Candidatus Woesearchaeota archaeon CG10_big_fil_rev_8_21_14_0_10_47_5]